MKDGSEQLVNSISDSIVFVVEGLSELLKTGQYSDFNTSLQKDMDRFLKSPKQAYGEIKLEQLEKSGAKLESVSYDGDLLGFDKMAKESKLSYAICKVDKGDINSDEKSLHLIYFKKDDSSQIFLSFVIVTASFADIIRLGQSVLVTLPFKANQTSLCHLLYDFFNTF